jgi:hypothetical protein
MFSPLVNVALEHAKNHVMPSYFMANAASHLRQKLTLNFQITSAFIQ